MGQRWREFMSWQCSSCGAESVIVEREDPAIDKAATFERACSACGSPATGTTIRPVGTAYRITTRRQFYPRA